MLLTYTYILSYTLLCTIIIYYILSLLHHSIVSPDVRDAYFGSLDRAFVGFTFIDDSAGHMMGSSSGHASASGGRGRGSSSGGGIGIGYSTVSGAAKAGPGATMMATSFKRGL